MKILLFKGTDAEQFSHVQLGDEVVDDSLRSDEPRQQKRLDEIQFWHRRNFILRLETKFDPMSGRVVESNVVVESAAQVRQKGWRPGKQDGATNLIRDLHLALVIVLHVMNLWVRPIHDMVLEMRDGIENFQNRLQLKI